MFTCQPVPVEPSIVPPHFTLDSKQIELTPQELEVVIWTKLNLSTEEVALRMEVSPSHVYRLRGNLRKKIGIDRSQSLEAFLIAGELVPGGASA